MSTTSESTIVFRPELPEHFTFKCADLNTGAIPFPDDSFDLVVATHIIEHLHQPVEFFGECLRVCRPGGHVYFSSPSDRSVWLPAYPFDPTKHLTLSFYDDPTHVGRPFSPQSYTRLSLYYGCVPVASGYLVSWPLRLASPVLLPLAMLLGKRWLIEKIVWGAVGWVSYAVVLKPDSVRGAPPFQYYIPTVVTPDDGVYRFFRKVARLIGAKRMDDGRRHPSDDKNTH